MIRAEQIENLSIIGRSSLELLRILPGVVSRRDDSPLRERQLRRRRQQHAGLHRQRHPFVATTGQPRRLALIDIGANSGLIVTLNNDMVQEVKVQSSNYAAEYGSGGVSVSAVTKGGSARSSTARSTTTSATTSSRRTIARTRSPASTKPKSKYQYPGGNIGGPIIIPGTDFNKDRDKAFFFVGFEVQRQKVDSGSRFGVVPTVRQRARRLQRVR